MGHIFDSIDKLRTSVGSREKDFLNIYKLFRERTNLWFGSMCDETVQHEYLLRGNSGS